MKQTCLSRDNLFRIASTNNGKSYSRGCLLLIKNMVSTHKLFKFLEHLVLISSSIFVFSNDFLVLSFWQSTSILVRTKKKGLFIDLSFFANCTSLLVNLVAVIIKNSSNFLRLIFLQYALRSGYFSEPIPGRSHSVIFSFFG